MFPHKTINQSTLKHTAGGSYYMFNMDRFPLRLRKISDAPHSGGFRQLECII